MNTNFTKETLRRAARTFVQAAISYVAVNLAVVNFGESKEVIKSAVVGLAVSALAAGVSAVMNLEPKYIASDAEEAGDESEVEEDV